MDSASDSTNPQNPHKKNKMDGCVVWLIEVGKEREGLYFWRKPKVAKAFRFYEIAESRGNCRICGMNSVVSQNRGRILHFFACEILRRIWWNRRICGVDFAGLWNLRVWILGFCGIVESLVN